MPRLSVLGCSWVRQSEDAALGGPRNRHPFPKLAVRRVTRGSNKICVRTITYIRPATRTRPSTGNRELPGIRFYGCRARHNASKNRQQFLAQIRRFSFVRHNRYAGPLSVVGQLSPRHWWNLTRRDDVSIPLHSFGMSGQIWAPLAGPVQTDDSVTGLPCATTHP